VEPGAVPVASSLVYILHYHPDHDARSILDAHRQGRQGFQSLSA